MAEYLQPLLSSIEAPVVFEAARAILSLATVSDGAFTAAPTLAVGALVDLWDHDNSGAARVQIMETLTQKLGALQVGWPGHTDQLYQEPPNPCVHS